jgi:hypothetical protein
MKPLSRFLTVDSGQFYTLLHYFSEPEHDPLTMSALKMGRS